ncbi:SH3 domain-containing protein [Azospirillum sp. sgz301742]
MRTRRFSLALALTLLLASCAPQTRSPPPLPPQAPATGFEPMGGKWDAGTDASLRSAPTEGAPVIGKLRAGQPVNALGRVRNSDWVAVPYGGATGYVRLHLLRLHDTAAVTVKGSSTVVPKPVDNAGPKVNAAPRGKIQAAPITP